MAPRQQQDAAYEEDVKFDSDLAKKTLNGEGDTTSDESASSDSSSTCAPAATVEYGRSPSLVKAVPDITPSPMPFHHRVVADLSAMVVPGLFYLGPSLLSATIPLLFWKWRVGLGLLLANAFLAYAPVSPWPAFRQCFQLWYERHDFHHNLLQLPPAPLASSSTSASSQETHPASKQNVEDTSVVIYSTHPHGVIPIHGYLWCAMLDQLFPQRYGVGALTDIALRLPFLRHVMSWLGSTNASKNNLVRHLEAGTNLYILPGGVAEIFLACPGKHVIKTPRRGLMKLALQTGALLVPCYAFGASDFYHQLATYQYEVDTVKKSNNGDPTNWIGKLQRTISRQMKGGFTFFWGTFGTPLAFAVKCSYVLGDPIEPVVGTLGQGRMNNGKQTCQLIPEPTDEQIDELLYRYMAALIRLFEQYKAEAGYPDAELIFE